MKEDERAELTQATTNISYIKEKLKELVTREEFQPVKLLVYGATGMMLSAVMGMLIKVALEKSATIPLVLP